MILRHHVPFLCLCFVTALGGSVGCAPTRTGQLGMMFLPPTPPASPTSSPAPEPVEAVPALYAKASPNLLAAIKPVAYIPPALDRRVERAEERFQSGKRLYQQGDLDGARREFDKAVDLLLMASVQPSADRHVVDRKMDELIAAIYRYDVEGLGSGEKLDRPGFDKAPLEDVLDLTFPVDPKLKPKVKDEIVATASQLPLQVNDSVLSYINFFNSDRGRRTLISGLRRAGKYKPMILRILAEEGVPQELIYLAQAESGFLPRAVSRAAASGMWQFVRERGNQYGLRQTAYTDERYDPEKATRAAARHLRDLYQQFGDWHLAIAAYNCGPGCVDRAVQRTGYADYWQLRARGAVPKETTNYVPIIVAMTIMAKNAKDYGLEDIDSEPPLEYENISLTAPVSLSLIADLSEHPLTELQELNPALLGQIAPGGYELHVPKGAQSAVMIALNTIPEGRRTSIRAHRMAAGESLSSVARQFNTSSSSLQAVNNFAEEPAAGELVLIPSVYSAPRTTATKSTAPARGYVRHGYTPRATRAPVTAGKTLSKAKTASPAKVVLAARATTSAVAHRGRTYATASLHHVR